MVTLACGPFFSVIGAFASLGILIAVKPLTYVAFIQAFRYRISRPIPMEPRQVARLVVIRTLAGGAIIGSVFLALRLVRTSDSGLVVPWTILSAERLGVWYLLGAYGARLRGRRLIGWMISGTLIDMAFDIAIAMSLGDMWVVVGGIAAAMVVFIVPLTIIGRRDTLKARFTRANICRRCEYDLTGNLSGVCPECGTAIAALVPA